MKTLFAADIALVRKDLGVITARLQSLEDSGDTAHCGQDAQQSELDKLKQANLLMEGRIAVLEDSKRQRNLKIWSVPEDATDSEIPHYLRRLLSSVLTPSKAKAILLDNYFRIPKPAKAPDGASRDLLICFQSLRSKQLVQAAICDAPSYHFEGADLTFFNDLTRSTIVWQQALRPLTQHLRQHEVAYCWGPGRKLTVLHDRKRIPLQQQSDARKFFKALGLPTPEAQQAHTLGADSQPSTQMWDVRNVRPFYPKTRPTAVESNLVGTSDLSPAQGQSF
ncbi:Hypothetical predicted protein [Pelobates cultripes]|uniref:Uncharacterized protein n=1 Tax=Pelobates cultripes TaxID=61616 RepID=A0AAD1SNY5_PELCU|nr:Hypothetical predicted protein [Pelobates cultripes]